MFFDKMKQKKALNEMYADLKEAIDTYIELYNDKNKSERITKIMNDFREIVLKTIVNLTLYYTIKHRTINLACDFLTDDSKRIDNELNQILTILSIPSTKVLDRNLIDAKIKELKELKSYYRVLYSRIEQYRIK